MNREKLEKYIEDTYSINAEHVFEKNPSTCVFRHGNNRKWFAIIMDIKKRLLGMDSDDTVTIINLKCDFILINSLLTERGFYPAYHMNKTHWITVLLDGTVEDQRIKDLIDISFDLTYLKKHQKRR